MLLTDARQDLDKRWLRSSTCLVGFSQAMRYLGHHSPWACFFKLLDNNELMCIFSLEQVLTSLENHRVDGAKTTRCNLDILLVPGSHVSWGYLETSGGSVSAPPGVRMHAQTGGEAPPKEALVSNTSRLWVPSLAKLTLAPCELAAPRGGADR